MIAQRVDDLRVVVLVGGGSFYRPQRELDAAPAVFRTRTLTNGLLFDLPARLLSEARRPAADGTTRHNFPAHCPAGTFALNPG
jgi:hypothetical protein